MWLPLAEYSMKHKVSISTLRRRIKAEDIQYRLEDGKYMIFDSDNSASSELATTTAHRPSLNSEAVKVVAEQSMTEDTLSATKVEGGESVLTAANRLLTDLKKAYTQVLQEKEQQIVELKKEISDLRTLVKVLESENDKQAFKQQSSAHSYFSEVEL